LFIVAVKIKEKIKITSIAINAVIMYFIPYSPLNSLIPFILYIMY
jgi:hypothetical protein